MTTVLDIQALQAAAGIRISLAENVRVRSGSVTSEAVQGFSDVRAVELVVRVPVLRGHPAPSVSVTVENSVNGSDWTTGHAFTFTATGDDSFTLDAPDDYLRVVCAPAGGLREAVVSVVASIVTVDAPGGGGGGSQSVKWVDLGLVDAAALAVSGRRTLYTTGAGEFLSALRFGDTVVSNDGVPIIVFEIGGLSIETADDAPYGQAEFAVAPVDSYSRGIVTTTYFNNGADRKALRSPGLQAGAFTATLAGGQPSHVLDNPSWQANHAYALTTAIIAAGHYWENGGAGTSGGSTPNFAGHIPFGNVVDGEVTWFDTGAIATQGSVHAYAEIVTPAVP